MRERKVRLELDPALTDIEVPGGRSWGDKDPEPFPEIPLFAGAEPFTAPAPNRPELLFLDEPTIGLDAVSKLALREFLQWENRQQGTTILLTTHDMEDIVALCPRVMVLGHGRKLFDGALPDLLGRYDTLRTVTVNYEEPEAVPELPASIPLARDGKNLTISYSPQEYATAELIARLQAAGTVRELTVQPQNIDRLVAAMYREMDL